MDARTLTLFPVLALLLVVAQAAPAGTEAMPTHDVAGSRDHPRLKRFEGSLIVSYESKAYDTLTLPLSRLEVQEQRNARNRRVLRAAQERSAEGAYTRIIYLIPEGRSPLEILRNYQQEITESGGSMLYECNGIECGGKLTGNWSSTGSNPGLLSYLYPEEKVISPQRSVGWCASSMPLTEQRYSVLERAKDGDETLYSILTYQEGERLNLCPRFVGRTFALVQILERKAREQKMVTVSAKEMRQALDTSGRVALYGIYFDYDQAVVKPDSGPMLDEIARLLRENPQLSVLIVGHTDSQGKFEYNIGLSERRARAVVEVLQTKHGIPATRMRPVGAGMIAPTASNDNEEGRAQNRRVELVKL
jgi:outer membrane protein OmpA-like peptidoglycan-associated protein